MSSAHTLLNPHSSLPRQGQLGVAELDPPTQQHLKSLRIQNGEEVVFMDGKGLLLKTRCVQIRPLVFEILSATQQPALNPPIELCLATPKGEALWDTITQATEIGVNSIRLLKTTHTQIPKGWEFPQTRAQKVSDAASSQCQRAWRVELIPQWSTLEDSLKVSKDVLPVFADETLSAAAVYGFKGPKADTKKIDAPQKIQLFIGPEGGWSAEEREFLGKRAKALGLGPLVLRVPTATVAALFFLRRHFWTTVP